MTQIRFLLVVVLVVELAGIAFLFARQSSRRLPPTPQLARLPQTTAADIQQLQAATQSERSEAWRELGEAYLAYGYFVEAEACLRFAAHLKSDDFATQYGWACSLDRMGRTREALEHFEAAAALDPNKRRQTLYQLARNFLRDEDGLSAERAFALLDGLPAADHQRARLLVAMGREAEAKFLKARLQKEYPDDLGVQLLALRIARFTGDGAAAAEAIDRAERSYPQFGLINYLDYMHSIRSRYGMHAALARVESANAAGELDDASDHFEKIVTDIDPEFLVNKLVPGAELAIRAGRPKDAQRLLTLLGDRVALTPGALHIMGDAWSALGDKQQARETWQRANRLRPRSETHTRLAELLEQDGDTAGAARERGLALLETGIQSYRENQLNAAREQLEQAAKSAPQAVRAWFYLGEVKRLTSQREEAIAAYRKCLELNPNHGRAHARLEILQRGMVETSG